MGFVLEHGFAILRTGEDPDADLLDRLSVLPHCADPKPEKEVAFVPKSSEQILKVENCCLHSDAKPISQLSKQGNSNRPQPDQRAYEKATPDCCRGNRCQPVGIGAGDYSASEPLARGKCSN